MTRSPAFVGALLLLAVIGAASQTKPPSPLDSLLAPVALYPDQLLAQMLESSKNPARVQEFNAWLGKNKALTGTALQDAARAQKFEPSLVLLALFPKVVSFMADNIGWTTDVGRLFTSNRQAIMDSIQRLRANAMQAGTLKDTPQQKVELKTLENGTQAIVIEPANPQVVYVPQYNPQVVYTNPPPTTTTIVVKEEEDNTTEAAIAGAMVGFGIGIAIGAAVDNDYYYGPYGWYGGPAMYNDAWDDWYDDREDAREDWYENREDAREDYRENRENLAEERTDRRENTQQQRTERQENREPSRAATSATTESRGSSSARAGTSAQRSGATSDAFSGYSSGRSERAASSRGKTSKSRSSGGARSRRR
jgi:hypothetical protein